MLTSINAGQDGAIAENTARQEESRSARARVNGRRSAVPGSAQSERAENLD